MVVLRKLLLFVKDQYCMISIFILNDQTLYTPNGNLSHMELNFYLHHFCLFMHHFPQSAYCFVKELGANKQGH